MKFLRDTLAKCQRAGSMIGKAALVLLIAATGHAAEPAEGVDFLTFGQGMALPSEHPPANIDTTTTDEFIPYASALSREGMFSTFQIPPNSPAAKFKYAGIGPVAVKPLHRYFLRFSAIKCYPSAEAAGELILSATYLKGGKQILFNNLYSFRPQLNILPTVEVELCTPPGADAIVLWIGWVNHPSQILAPSPKVIFTELRLVPNGRLTGNPEAAASLNENLLAVSDFEDLPLGPLADPKGHRIFNIRTPEIVQADTRCLRITKSTAESPFPYFSTNPVSLLNCGVEFSCKVKGKGTVHPMLWWWLKNGSWFHYADQQIVELTDEWQTIRIWLPCLNPAQVYAAGSVAINSQEADLYVDDVSLRIIQP